MNSSQGQMSKVKVKVKCYQSLTIRRGTTEHIPTKLHQFQYNTIYNLQSAQVAYKLRIRSAGWLWTALFHAAVSCKEKLCS